MLHEGILQCRLFRGMTEEQIGELLREPGIGIRNCGKNEMVLQAGGPAEWVGVLLEGSAMIFTTDYLGNRTILTTLGPTDIFAEAFVCAGVTECPVTVQTGEKSRILYMTRNFLFSDGPGKEKVLQNLLRLVAGKNVNLNQKIQIMSRKTTSEKLLAYLSMEAQKAGSREFTIPFTRQELADFLGVERSAMSAELGKLAKRGILWTDRKKFRLLRETDGMI